MSSEETIGGTALSRMIANFIQEQGLDPSVAPALEELIHHSEGRGATLAGFAGNLVETLVLDGAAPTTQAFLSGDGTSQVVDDLGLTKASFESLKLLGRGGMAEVHRSHDEVLNRMLAIKVLHARFSADSAMRARFLAEAQVTAQLAHPSIPPVHAVGELDMGMPFFTMKEVHGDTLSQTIRQVYQGDHDDGAWSQTRLLGVYQKVCEAMAYAHARGVVHADLKPANIMVGAFGEVLVMDWGVARLVRPVSSEESVEGQVSVGPSALTTDSGAVAGTPAYMPPEQAQGYGHLIGPQADVYALGVVLFELLTGKRPYSGSPAQMLFRAGRGKLPPMTSERRGDVDDGLRAIVQRAMQPAPDDRYPHAGALAEEIARWLEGSIRKERALAEVRVAQARLADVAPIQQRAIRLRQLAEERLAALGVEAMASEKSPAWGLQDEAHQLESAAKLAVAQITQQLNNALAEAPDLHEAHELLAQIHFDEHQAAEARRDSSESARLEILLRAHDVGDYAGYLAGTSALTLHTHVPAEATVYRYEERDRRLEAVDALRLGRTPLIDVALPVGSYLLLLDAGDRPVVRYPFRLTRTRPWRARPPNHQANQSLYLPRENELLPGECYVPGGWADIGGDPRATGSGGLQRIWVEGFAIQRTPISTQEFLRFLASNDEGAVEARRALLRSRIHVFRPDWPAVGVSWSAARAYARWYGAQTGLAFRLPSEVEWEKAARGPDGRFHPWGDRFDFSFTLVRGGERLPQHPRDSAADSLDQSPYGVGGLSGNVRDWCADRFLPDGPESLEGRRGVSVAVDGVPVPGVRSVRGGSWRQPDHMARSSARSGLPGVQGFSDTGFRLARTIGEP